MFSSGFRFISAIVIISLFMASFSAKAAEDVDIFQVKIKLKDRSHNSQIEAMKQGLLKVFVRASGVEGSTSNEYLISKLNKAQSFIQQFSYSRTEPYDSEYPWTLTIKYEADSIRQLLSDAGIAIWGERRPVALLWVAQQDNNSFQRHIIESGSQNALQINELAEERAIPILIPDMDDTDKNQVELTDVWGRFSSPIIKASRRYHKNVIVFGRVFFEGGKWHADWQAILENVRAGWKYDADSVEQIYDQMLQELGVRLCQKYCVLTSQTADNQMLIKIENINNFINAASAEKYLQSLLPVRDVNLIQLKHHYALYRLRLVSREQSVLEAITLDSALKPLPPEYTEGLSKRIYSYQWQP